MSIGRIPSAPPLGSDVTAHRNWPLWSRFATCQSLKFYFLSVVSGRQQLWEREIGFFFFCLEDSGVVQEYPCISPWITRRFQSRQSQEESKPKLLSQTQLQLQLGHANSAIRGPDRASPKLYIVIAISVLGRFYSWRGAKLILARYTKVKALWKRKKRRKKRKERKQEQIGYEPP